MMFVSLQGSSAPDDKDIRESTLGQSKMKTVKFNFSIREAYKKSWLCVALFLPLVDMTNVSRAAVNKEGPPKNRDFADQ